MRTFLKENSILSCRTKSLNVDFTIDNCIGSGANCFVYDAHFYEDGVRRNYRIKELYPHEATIERKGCSLEWNNIQERISSEEKFMDAYRKLSLIQSQESLGNQTVQATAVFDCNNTLYSVINADFGVSYDKVTKKDIKSVLVTMIALTKIIAEYHKLGFLHLDIKPSNFLIKYEPTLCFKLFDVDTVTPINKIKEVKTISYTSDYAAPEQKQCLRKKICPATDIFAVGSILFERIMGRKVAYEDMGIFAEWNLDDIEQIQHYNPRIKRLLANIFEKTLAANVKNRYQNAEELICALEEVQQLVICGKPYLVSNFFPNKPNFIGREKELEMICTELQKNHMVFIHGMGGIGKSELAQKYAEKFKTEYDAIVLLRYTDSLINLFSELNIENCQSNTTAERFNVLKSILVEEKVLFIIDNFNVDKDDYIDNLCKLNASFIFTTRTDFSETYGDFASIMKLNELSKDEQLALFERNLGKKYTLSKTEKTEITHILDYIEGYTLLIPLIAKQISKGLYAIADTCEKLKAEGIKKISHVKVKLFKDGTTISGNVYEILRAVLNVNSLSPSEQEILKILSLIGENYCINRNELCSWFFDYCEDNHLDDINTLVDAGWIRSTYDENEPQLSLHSIICTLCKEEYEPSLSNCMPLQEYLLNTAYDLHRRYSAFTDNEIGVEFGNISSVDSYVYKTISELLLQLMRNIEKTSNEELNMYAEIIYLLSNVKLETIKDFQDFLLCYVNNQKATAMNIDFLRGAYLALYTYALHDEDGEHALVYAKKISKVTEQIMQETPEDRLINAVFGTLASGQNAEDMIFGITLPLYQYIVNNMFYYEISEFDEIAQLARKEWKQAFKNPNIKEQLQSSYEHFLKLISPKFIEETEDMLFGRSFDEEFTAIENEINKEQINHQATEEEKIVKDLRNSACDIEWQLDQLIENNGGTVMDVSMPKELLMTFSWWWVSKNPIIVNSYKGELLGRIKDLDELFHLDYSNVNSERTIINCQQAKTEAALAYWYAILGEIEQCQKHFDILMPFYKSIIMAKDPEWGHFKGYIDKTLPGFATLINQYEQVLDVSIAIKYLEAIIKIMEQYANIHNCSDDLIEVYKLIIEMAEKNNDEQIANHYQHKMSVISGIRFKKR